MPLQWWPSGAQLLLLSVVLCALHRLVPAQLSNPIAHDSQINAADNKYLQRQAKDDAGGQAARDEEVLGGECPFNIQLKWMTEVSSSVYATPLITDLFSDGHKDIVVPSFVHHMEVLEGADGAKAAGWPAFHKSTVHTSPLLFDIDFDGVLDVGVATYDGEVLWFKDTGEALPEASTKLVVPRLRVRRDWFRGLAPDHVDHSHPDVGDSSLPARPMPVELGNGTAGVGIARRRSRALLQAADAAGAGDASSSEAAGGDSGAALEGAEGLAGAQSDEQGAAVVENAASQLSDEAEESFHALFGEGAELGLEAGEEGEDGAAGDQEAAVGQADGGEGGDKPLERHPAGHGFEDDPHRDAEPGSNPAWGRDEDYTDDWAGDLGHDHYGDGWWGDEQWHAPPPPPTESEWVMVDAHILCTPTLADLDGDGTPELVVAASYFFDREYYDAPEHAGELPAGVDPANYIANGLLAFDLRTRLIRWHQHLDLSTDHTAYRAYAYSAPTAADLDRDGRMEVLAGTSEGFLYVLDWDGAPRAGWPLQLGELQGQVAVADVDGDGYLEVLAGDARGSVALFTWAGKEVWERHLGSLIAQNAVFGDVNGDGRLEVVVATAGGAVHVLDAASGADVKPFPFQTRGRVMAAPLITRLREGPSQQLVFQSFDGHLYIVDGLTGCADTVDVGETSYGSVLADDLDGNGRLDLLLATMNGNVYAFETPARYHPLKAWTSQVPGGNNFVAGHNMVGVFATEATRAPRDVRGDTLLVRFEIVDKRPNGTHAGGAAGGAAAGAGAQGGAPHAPERSYTVAVTLQGVGIEEMGAGDQPVIGMTDTFTAPGVYSLALPTPRTRSTATVHLEMRDQNRLTYVDEFALSFHMHFHRLLKWLVAGPLVVMAAAVLSVPLAGSTQTLPSFRSSIGQPG